MRKIILSLFLVFGAALSVSSQTNVSYTAFNGTVYNMRAFFNNYTVTLIPEEKMIGLDTNVVERLAAITDSSYQYAVILTGKFPPLSKHINGKATVAYVEETCGAGCGIVGGTGIEVGTTYFFQMYQGVKNNYIRGAIYAYEIGRNFWFYENKVNFTTGFFGGWAEAFATQMHQQSPRYAFSWKEYPLSETSYFETELSRFALGCVIADTLDFYAHLTAAIQLPLFDRYRNPRLLNYYAHGFLAFLNSTFGDNMINNFWKEIDKLPDRVTNADAIDNVFIAASKAVGKNLSYLFETTFRFPVSPAAKSLVSSHQCC